jgi:hypothetical protein
MERNETERERQIVQVLSPIITVGCKRNRKTITAGSVQTGSNKIFGIYYSVAVRGHWWIYLVETIKMDTWIT